MIAERAAPASAKPLPNVILIVVDTLRADHLSHFGYERKTGVGLDRLARDATLFTNVYAPTGWTAPSVASIMTGLFPTRHGLQHFGERLRSKVRTLAEVLHDNGWQTAGHSFNHNITRVTGFQQGFGVFEHHVGAAGAYDDISEMLERAELWAKNGPRPFFLYLQPMNVHGPYKVPKRFQRTLLGRRPTRRFKYYGPLMAGIVSKQDMSFRERFTPRHLESLVDQYDTAIRYSFDQLAGFFHSLQRLKLYQDSLIVMTSDHGEELFDHQGFSHGYSLYREVTHVPLYIKLPRQRNGGSVDQLVSLMDIYPTILDALDLPEDTTKVDGYSLLPLIRGGSVPKEFDHRVLAHTTRWEQRCTARGLTTDRYRYIEIEQNYEGLEHAVRLFDRDKDPQERHDLSERLPEEVARLRRQLVELFGDAAGQAVKSDNVLDQMDRKKLKALGYVQ